LLTVLVSGTVVFCALLFYAYLRSDMPSVEELENFEPELSTKLLDRNGDVVKELFTQRRFYVPLSEIPLHVQQAFIAVEDHKFYQHWGMRPLALVGAFLKNLAHFDFHFRGASTITQQLARNLYYSSQRTVIRKIREALTAIEIERYYSKDEILEMYLTLTYFGSGSYGIGAASQTFFSKPPSDLTIDEAAMLAALPKSPTRYNPITNPDNAIERRNVVLWRMRETGFISDKQYDEFRGKPLALNPSTEETARGIAPYFTENVRQQLNSIGKSFGFDPYGDGVTVHTTLDTRLQICAEQAVAGWLPQLQKQVNSNFSSREFENLIKKLYPDSSAKAKRRMQGDRKLRDSLAATQYTVQVAFVALDPANGDILAMIGGRDFDESKFNRATQAIRQPGSSFKPFVYAAVLNEGLPITTRVSNEPLSIRLATGEMWEPANYDTDYGGYVDLRQALYRSLNVATVRLIRDYTSPKEVAQLAHKLGISTPLDPYDALALGASGVIPLDLVSAYQVFEAGGIWSKPMYITDVDDPFGQPIVHYRPERKAVLSEETAFLVESLLRSVVDRGTGAALRSTYNFRRPAAGKTGTTNDYTDAWFIGFTPHISAGVWVGLDDPAKRLGRGQQGARAALPIWAKFITAAYDTMDYPNDDFRMPSGIIAKDICVETGQVATSGCPEVRTEYFNRKFPLPEACTRHPGTMYPNERPSLF
jgi:penicillin-binding protein 1A